jgi:hypothetical protein
MLATLLAGCSASIEKKDYDQYKNIAIVCLVKNQVMFTEQGPLPIQIKQQTEMVTDWQITENLRNASFTLLSEHFNPVPLDYDPVSLAKVFDEHGNAWPKLTSGQTQSLREIVRDKPIDAILVIKEGYLPLGEIKGVIEGMGILHRQMLFNTVEVHSLLSGRLFEAENFTPIAYHGTAIMDFRDFDKYPWSFGFGRMTAQAKQEAKTLVKQSGETALQKMLTQLGLLDDQ